MTFFYQQASGWAGKKICVSMALDWAPHWCRLFWRAFKTGFPYFCISVYLNFVTPLSRRLWFLLFEAIIGFSTPSIKLASNWSKVNCHHDIVMGEISGAFLLANSLSCFWRHTGQNGCRLLECAKCRQFINNNKQGPYVGRTPGDYVTCPAMCLLPDHNKKWTKNRSRQFR